MPRPMSVAQWSNLILGDWGRASDDYDGAGRSRTLRRRWPESRKPPGAASRSMAGAAEFQAGFCLIRPAALLLQRHPKIRPQRPLMTPISGHPRHHDHGLNRRRWMQRYRHFRFVPEWPGPTATNSSFVAPLFAAPPPKAIPQGWLKIILSPNWFLIVPTNFPVLGSKALMSPSMALLETSRVLLSGPKLLGARVMPQG